MRPKGLIHRNSPGSGCARDQPLTLVGVVTFTRRADVDLDGLAAAGVVAGVVEVAAPGRAGAAGAAAVAVADADVVGEWAAGEPGVRVGGQPAAELVAVGPGVGDLGQHPVPVAQDRVGAVAAQLLDGEVQLDDPTPHRRGLAPGRGGGGAAARRAAGSRRCRRWRTSRTPRAAGRRRRCGRGGRRPVRGRGSRRAGRRVRRGWPARPGSRCLRGWRPGRRPTGRCSRRPGLGPSRTGCGVTVGLVGCLRSRPPRPRCRLRPRSWRRLPVSVSVPWRRCCAQARSRSGPASVRASAPVSVSCRSGAVPVSVAVSVPVSVSVPGESGSVSPGASASLLRSGASGWSASGPVSRSVSRPSSGRWVAGASR